MIIWSILFAVAINDLTRHKIPNNLLLLLFLFVGLSKTTTLQEPWLLEHSLGLVLFFSIALLAFFFGAMSPGDVKLLAVIGFIVGISNTWIVLFWILMAAGLVSSLYIFFNLSILGVTNPLFLINERSLYINANDGLGKTNPWRYGGKLTMPFAPSVVIGLAMFYYFN